MASVCMSQASYQQPQHHFQIMNGNITMLQQHQLQQQQQQQQQQQRQQQIIAPAPSKVLGSSTLHNIQQAAAGGLGVMLPRKKYTYNNMPYGEQLPSVARRNARERNRVKQVNNGFANLRQHLPQTVISALSHGGRGASKKLSKVDTLRIAVEYIRGLKDLLDDGSGTGAQSEDSNDASQYAFSALDQHMYNSEASASPTPSYTDSDISIGGANYLPATVKLEQQHTQPEQRQHDDAEEHFKFEQFDDYSPLGSDEHPDDEELLDYISSWQEQ